MSQLIENPALIWFLIGLVLLMAELFLPGLIVIFFGVGAWVTALAYLEYDLSINSQLVVFLLSSLFSLVLFRRSLQKHFWQKQAPANLSSDEFMGRTCSVVEPIVPGPGGGKVFFKGTTWRAQAQVEIPAGETVRIVGKDSIVLRVEPVI